MGKLRKPVAYLCALLLSWMSVVAGAVPVSAQNLSVGAGMVSHLADPGMHHPVAPATMTSMHAGHHASLLVDAGMNAKTGHRDHQRACIEACLSTIAAKLLPALAAAEKPQPHAIKIDWPREAVLGVAVEFARPAYWPTGPPGDAHRLGSGTARLVALNARLRN